jgi:hypothetical protein
MRTNSVRYWKEKRKKLLEKYDNLTDEDLIYNEGNEKEMIEKVGSKLGKTMKELLSIIVTL